MQLLVALDQLGNTLLGGYADETLSARAFRCHLQGDWPAWPYEAIDGLFFWQAAHCHRSWRSEWERHQMPGHYRHGCLSHTINKDVTPQHQQCSDLSHPMR